LVGASKVAFIWLSTWFWFVHWWQIATSVIWRISNASLFMHLAQVGMLPRRIITLGKELGWTKTHGYDHNQFDGSTNREEETKHQWMGWACTMITGLGFRVLASFFFFLFFGFGFLWNLWFGLEISSLNSQNFQFRSLSQRIKIQFAYYFSFIKAKAQRSSVTKDRNWFWCDH
jgi:hypothetical protein